MARVAGPADKFIPGLAFQTPGGVLPLVVPIDLPEGGYLQVIVGENPMGQAIPSTPLPKGCMVAIIPPEAAEHFRHGLNREYARNKHLNPYTILPGDGLPGSELIDRNGS